MVAEPPPPGESTPLIRAAFPANHGRPYRHSCPLAAFEAVAHALDALNGKGTSAFALAGPLGLPSTQVATAFAFLRERGNVEVRQRRNPQPRPSRRATSPTASPPHPPHPPRSHLGSPSTSRWKAARRVPHRLAIPSHSAQRTAAAVGYARRSTDRQEQSIPDGPRNWRYCSR